MKRQCPERVQRRQVSQVTTGLRASLKPMNPPGWNRWTLAARLWLGLEVATALPAPAATRFSEIAVPIGHRIFFYVLLQYLLQT